MKTQIPRPGLAVFGLLMVLCTAPPSGQTAEAEKKAPSVQEMVERANRVAYYQGKDGRAKVTMVITDSQGRQRRKQFTILRRDDPPPKGTKDDDTYAVDQKFYVYFRLPADERKTVFMVWKHLDKDDDRWLYLPALDLVKRIAATEERTSFVGSDFFYEDVSGRNIAEDDHEFVETTENYYVLKNVPKDPKAVEFSYYKMWIHRDSFVTVKVIYFDKKGEKYRVYEALNVEEIQGYRTVTKSKMQDLRRNSHTVIEYRDVKYDIGLPEDIFTERYLRRPPTEYLK